MGYVIMTRIAGINIPINKKILISLTYIYGIGKRNSNTILNKANIKNIKTNKLSISDIKNINNIIEKSYVVEGNLRISRSIDIKSLIDIKSYRGNRHLKKLPLRGQRTHTNARTMRGKKNNDIYQKRNKKMT